MKYPSADSLNSATDNAYTYDRIVNMEGYFLSIISWELLQYTVLDFLHLFLAQGCFFPSDRIILLQTTQRVTKDKALELKKHAEFFTDFVIQEQDLICESTHLVACAILALARKHLNCGTIWPYEMELVTLSSFNTFKRIYSLIELKYA